MVYKNFSIRVIRKGLDRGRGLDGEGVLSDLRKRTSLLRTRIRNLDRRLREMEHGALQNPLAPVVDTERCVGCGLCERICPVNAISINETAWVDLTRCIGCGACIDQCPRSALKLHPLVRHPKTVNMQIERSPWNE